MKYMPRNIFCLVIIFLIFSHRAFGIWTSNTGLPVPKQGAIMTCVGWITFYGFKDDDFKFNNEKAKNRLVTLDENASTWAAMYAYELSGSFHTDKADFLPQIFCEQREASDKEYPFLRLRDEKKTCTDWIYLYGYSKNNDALNRLKAIKQDTSMDEYIALWADGYARFICKKTKTKYVLPSEYCEIIGKSRELDLMPLVDRKGSQFSCEGWNDLYDYTGDVQNNYIKASKLHDLQFTHIHIWVRGYAAELRRRDINKLITPKEFCDSLDLYSIDFFRPVQSVKIRL